MEKNSFIASVHEDYKAFLDIATDEEIGKFIRAQVCQASGLEIPALEGMAKALFDTHNALMGRLENSRLKKSDAGQKGGAPKGNQNAKKQPETTYVDLQTTENKPNTNTNTNTENIIFDFWNENKIIVHKEINPDAKKAINKALKSYSVDEIKLGISHYAEMLKDDTYKLCDYKWNLEKFLSQGNALPEFLDDGEKWINYRNHKTRGDPKLFLASKSREQNNTPLIWASDEGVI